ncbi:MAG: hypothetical protein JSS55_14055 [Proteobacteria bacterium]|nr:hypothetical protein [Pseudomonadota bacterium]
MHVLARIGAALVGLFGIALGFWFYTDTAAAAASFFVEPLGNAGLATLRADMSAFFLVSGLWAFYAAWKEYGTALLVPAALYGIAISGRAVNLVAAGPYEGAVMPMTVEALLVALCLFGYFKLRPVP